MNTWYLLGGITTAVVLACVLGYVIASPWGIRIATTRYWRRTICPHGYRYTEPDRCQQCPYPRYGYGRKIRRRTYQRPAA